MAWWCSAGDAQKPEKNATPARFRDLLAELVELAKAALPEEKVQVLAKPHWLPDGAGNPN